MAWETIKPEIQLGYVPSGGRQPNLWSVKVCKDTNTNRCYLIKCRRSKESGYGEIKLSEFLPEANIEKLFAEYVQQERKRIHNSYSKHNSGYTLIEVLVVISILGVLASIIFAASSRYIHRARETEAKAFISSINKAQQSHFTEYNEFAEDLGQAGVVVDGTPYYRYEIAFVDGEKTIVHADANQPMLRGMAGVVWVDGAVTRSKVCVGQLWNAPVCLPD